MFDFVTSIWPGAQRAPAGVPPTPRREPTLDDCWKVASKRPANKRKASSKRPAKAKKPSLPIDGGEAVLLALLARCRECGQWRMMSVTELAEAMHCSVGEASKRVKKAAEVEQFIWTLRRGRQKMVGLHRVSSEQWQRIVSSTPPAAIGLYRICTVRRNSATTAKDSPTTTHDRHALPRAAGRFQCLADAQEGPL